MEIIKPSIKLIMELEPEYVMNKIEKSARICYRSESKGDSDLRDNFLRNLIKSGHTSVLEHVSFTFDIITSRAIHNEHVRHRIASYSAESTRYCNYNKMGLQFIEPLFEEIDEEHVDLFRSLWEESCSNSEISYNKMIEAGIKPQLARDILNLSLKTLCRCTMNVRTLRNFFNLRCAKSTHPEFKILTIPFLLFMQKYYNPLFGDIEYDKEFYDKYLSDDRWFQYLDISIDDTYDFDAESYMHVVSDLL